MTSYTGTARPESVVRTLVETMPPTPTARLFSTTTTRFARSRYQRISVSGHGRKQETPSTPILCPFARSSSTVSLIVPSTEPSAITTVSASSMA